ncbi:hypothetical protein L7F22_026920, partial [Adiantum nelumboides]|nr:hypothetical protein [Adiantum nelumboides]
MEEYDNVENDCTHHPNHLEEEIDELAITRSKAKGPIDWEQQKGVRDRVQKQVQKEQQHQVLDDNFDSSDEPAKQSKKVQSATSDWFE